MVFKDKLTNLNLWLLQILTAPRLCVLGPVGGPFPRLQCPPSLGPPTP